MNSDDVSEKIVSGKMKFHEAGKDLGAMDAAAARRRAVEKLTGASLDNVSKYSFDAEVVSTKNVENMIGVCQVPLGVAGPLKIRGDHAKGEYYIPLATTEGALVASVNRGASAITKSGGSTAYVENVGMTRAPVFRTSGIEESRKFAKWAEDNFGRIKKEAESTTRFGKLTAVRPFIVGRNVYLRFSFDTKDAMGMNMAVMACEKVITELVEKETKVKCISLSGNMCADKKANAVNFILGRGKKVHAEAVIKKDILQSVLKTNARDIVEVNYRKNLLGSAMAGALGFNAHYANMVAALFIACGQDPAHVVEASMGITTCEELGDNLYISVYLPNVNVGTVGGGTSLATQKEALSILGVSGASENAGENALKFAEIVGSTVLAGELSLLAANATGDLARAHAKYGRGKK